MDIRTHDRLRQAQALQAVAARRGFSLQIDSGRIITLWNEDRQARFLWFVIGIRFQSQRSLRGMVCKLGNRATAMPLHPVHVSPMRCWVKAGLSYGPRNELLNEKRLSNIGAGSHSYREPDKERFTRIPKRRFASTTSVGDFPPGGPGYCAKGYLGGFYER